MNFCPNCGAQVTEGTKFCVSCGTPLVEEVAASPVSAEKPPKKSDKKGVWIVLAVVLVLVVALAAVVGMLFFGNNTQVDEAVLGTYEIVEGDYGDTAKDAEDDYIELLEKGKAEVSLLGSETDGKFKLEEDALTLKVNKEEYTGTLADGIIVLEYEGVSYTYVHEDRMESYLEQKEQERKAAIKVATVGYWVMLKTESEDPAKAFDEETLQMVRDAGVPMHMVLNEDGTGSLVISEPMAISWDETTVSTEEETWPYRLEDDKLILDSGSDEMIIWFVKGEAPEVPEEPEDPFGEPVTFVAIGHIFNGTELTLLESASIGDTYIEFYGDGTGYLVDCEGHWAGEEYEYRNAITYDEDTVYDADTEHTYYLDGNELHLTVIYEGNTTEYICVPEENLAIDSVKEDFWEGEWYGWYAIRNGTGAYEDWTGDWDDIYAKMSITKYGTGYMRMWTAGDSRDEPMMEAGMTLRDGATKYGALVCEEGYLWDIGLESGEWTIDVGDSEVSQYENMICLKLHYVASDDANNTLDYDIYLRPWGMKWEDMRDVHDPWEVMLPYYYDDWYLPLLEMGISELPDSYNEGLALLG